MRVALALIGLLALAPSATASELHATYVTPDEIDLQRVLPPPPAPDSPEGRADLAAVEAAVRARTPTDAARIAAQKPCTAEAFADGVLEPAVTPQRLPLTTALVEHAFEDTELAVLAAKAKIGRARPYTLDPGLDTLGHRSSSASYPSGHAACGRIIAIVLAAIFPAKAEALYARGTLYGRNRMLAGTHFPSDLIAGATAGSIVGDALFRNPKFRADLALATKEAAAAAPLP